MTYEFKPSKSRILCTFLAAHLALQIGSFRRLRDLTQESIVSSAREHSSFIENVERHRAIKLLGAETLREDAWGQRFVQSINASFRVSRFAAHIAFAGAGIGAIQSVVILMLGAEKVIAGAFTLGMLLAFMSYGALFASRTYALIQSLVQFRMLRLHRERFADIALEERESPLEHVTTHRSLHGSVELRDLSFRYGERGPMIFQGLDLKIESGEFVAIEGESGSGKSTLIKLLCKLLEPTKGRILVDGFDINNLDTQDYRRQLGVVMQDDDLFSGSLLENIAAEEGNADHDQLENAARMACIHHDIQSMPMAYQTLVGHMGSTLSGGQRQRVMIARAIYRHPALILLDEGTAHLNDLLQQQIFDHLQTLNVTIIAATHDERILRRADRRISLSQP